MRTDGSTITIQGRAAADPVTSSSGGVERVTVRVISTERRYEDSTGTWVDGDEYGVAVVCWRQLAAGVSRLVRKGDPVIVLGRISTRKFERNGSEEYFTEVKADAVAFDIGRAKDRIRRADDGDAPAAAPATTASDAEPADELDMSMADAELAGAF